MKVQTVGVFTPEDAREIKHRVLGKQDISKQKFTHKNPASQDCRYAVLKERLRVASSPLTGYTSAKAYFVRYKDSSLGLNYEMEVADDNEEADEITIINRSTTNEAFVDDVILIKFVQIEWAPVWGGGGSDSTTDLKWGIVHEDLSCGYYVISLSEHDSEVPSIGPSSSGCDPCFDPVSSGIDDCEDLETPTFTPQTTELSPPVYVIGYDPQSVIVPLLIGSDCIVHAPVDASSSTSLETVYKIVRGFQVHTVQYEKVYECCNGVDTLVGKRPIIFAAKVCEMETCFVCEIST